MNRIASGGRVPRAILAAGALALGLLAPSAAEAAPAARAELGAVAAPGAELRASGTVTLSGGAVVRRYQQRVAGLDVRGAEAVVVDGPGPGAALVSDSTRGTVRAPAPPSLESAISSARAIAAATRAVGADELRGPALAELAIEPRPGGAEALAWEVLLPSARPLGDFVVLVDAASGAVLERTDLLRRVTGQAKVYLPNPVVQNDGYRGMRDRRDRNTRKLNRLRSPVTLARMDSGQRCLRGAYAIAKAGTDPRNVCRSSRDWRPIRRSKGSFEAVMAYHHVDRTQAYVQSLELTEQGDGDLNAEPQRVVANGFGADNSFYTPFGDEIVLGTGGVDDGEDADVIVHEYGHALQDAQVRNFGLSSAAGSMGEGFGDYLAAAMSSRWPKPPPPLQRDWNACIFEWDATSYTSNDCLRRTSRDWTKPFALDHCRREIHCVGQAWSGALWELRGELGQDPLGRGAIMDRVVIASHFMLDKRASFGEGARALLCADEALYPFAIPGDCEGLHHDEIRAEMHQRRFLP